MRSTIEWGKLHPNGLNLPMRWSPEALEDAYKRCGTITADYAKTFYLVGNTPPPHLVPGCSVIPGSSDFWFVCSMLPCKLQPPAGTKELQSYCRAPS